LVGDIDINDTGRLFMPAWHLALGASRHHCHRKASGTVASFMVPTPYLF